MKVPTCKFFMAGKCNRGTTCRFRHGEEGEEADEVHELPPLQEQTCCICYDTPTVFGLLVSCQHVFCLSCLMQWRDKTSKAGSVLRDSTALKVCPICRELSHFVVPSSIFPETEAQKKGIVERFKAKNASIPCRYFEKSNKRTCPFGDNCMYGHRDASGKKVLNVQKPSGPSRGRCPMRHGGGFVGIDVIALEGMFGLAGGYDYDDELLDELEDYEDGYDEDEYENSQDSLFEDDYLF
ncbi:hypothetical protein HK101_001431 [Irineochytrium annulatum]|nr:hypothetical protein HK101_001431 [Irineochytrium annulatum]